MEKIVPKKEWSVAMRLNHWLTALSIFVLIPTGFYIADPFILALGRTVDKSLMGDVRFWHIGFGILLCGLFFWRLYLAFFSRFHADWKDFLAWTNWQNTVKQIRFYLLISKEPPEHTHLYGPLQSLAYAGLFCMVLLIGVTGVILIGSGNATLISLFRPAVKPIVHWMGGLAMIRWFHHILTWGFVLFIAVHIYMAFWYDIIFREGTVSSMISGWVFRRTQE